MKKRFLLAAATSIVFASCALRAQPAPATAPAAVPSTQLSAESVRRISYAFGVRVANDVKSAQADGIELDLELVKKGLDDSVAGREAYTDAQMQEAFEEVGRLLQAKREADEARQMTELAQEGAKNAAAGDAFRAEFEKRPGVVKTDTGLLIETLAPGAGPTPQATDTVKVNYAGTFIDGTKFDASADHGGPLVRRADRVIAGWTEALTKMKVGGKVRIVVPPALGYGEAGYPGAIPPNATLVFEMELLSIEPPQPDEQQ